ncbi:MAG: hypothetical protein WA960_22400 [Tunicatimonas sp.]
MKRIICCLLLFLMITAAHAQQPAWEAEEGEIDDTEVIIEKDREIELPSASRQFERVPPNNVVTPEVKVTYQFKDFTPRLPAIDPKIKVLKIKDPPLDKLYGNYVKAGFGNFLSPYLDFYANSTRNDAYTYGVHLEHLSSRFGPVDGDNSGNSHSQIGVNGKYFVGGNTLSGEVGYERNRYHFYGYQPGLEVDRDDIKQVFNVISAQLTLEREQVDKPLDYAIGGSFRTLNDDYAASENQIGLQAQLQYAVNEQFKFGLSSDVYLMQRTDQAPLAEASQSTNRNLFRINPTVTFNTSDEPQRGLVVQLGFRAVYENDTALNAGQLHLYPDLSAHYNLSDGFSLYAGIDGDIERTSLLDFVEENPFLGPDVPLLHTNRTLAFRGGLQGRFTSAVGFRAGFSVGNYRHLYFYANSALDSTRFTILYDQEKTLLFNPFLEITINSAERFRTTLRGDYFSYSVNQVREPWHRPTAQLSVLSTYNAYDKLLFSAELMALGGIQGLNLASDTQKALDPIIDLSFQADYLFSSRFSTFLQLKNIFAQNYERFLNYPSRGLMVMGGVSYSF